MNLTRTLLIGVILILAVCVSAGAQSDTKAATSSPLANAEALIKAKKAGEAESVLKDFLAGMPAGWKPVVEEKERVLIAYWDMGSFRACAIRDREDRFPGKKIVWAQPSYSKAYYYLAFIAIEAARKGEARQYIEKALTLEPDNPMLLNERGLILRGMGDYEGSVKSYDAVLTSKGCVPDYHRAVALRGKGVSLIDLGKLDEAEQALNDSLQIDPKNKLALNEIEYIRRLRAGTVPNKAPLKIVPSEQPQAK